MHALEAPAVLLLLHQPPLLISLQLARQLLVAPLLQRPLDCGVTAEALAMAELLYVRDTEEQGRR